jgi:glycosyltransferase involved in cell wall biosynthesis
MDALFIVNQPYPLGMAGSKRIRLFAESLAQRGNAVELIIRDNGNYINSPFGKVNNVSFSTLTTRVRNKFIFRLLHSSLLFFRVLKTHFKHDSKERILFIYGDVDIHCLPAFLLAHYLKYKPILDVVEDRSLTDEKINIRTRLNLAFKDFFLPIVLKRCAAIITISKYLEKKYQDYNCPSIVKLIPISATNLSRSKQNDSLVADSTVTLTYCGSFGLKDGINFLLSAFKEVNKVSTNIQLKLIGEPSAKVFQKYDISNYENIIFTGYLNEEDYWDELANSNVLLMTRTNSNFANAGFPFKLGEYLATGNPVIATKVSDIECYLIDREDAFLIEPSSTESIKLAILEVLSDLDYAKNIGLNGKRKCKEFFDPTKNNLKFLQLIDDVMGRSVI